MVAVNLFEQFSPPSMWPASLMTITLLLPLLLPPAQPRPLADRLTALMMWLWTSLVKQLFPPTTDAPCPWALPSLMLAYFLTGLNLQGLLPYTFTPTTHLSVDLGLALPLWLTTILLGMGAHLTAFIGHLLPISTPTPLIPILATIETISLLIRPLALGVRLTANMTAGHLLLHLMTAATNTLLSTFPPAICFTLATLTAFLLLELAVAVIQAYVFTLLFTLYLKETT